VRDPKQRPDGAESNRLLPKQVPVLLDRLVPALRAVRQQLREGDSRIAELRIRGDGPTVGRNGSFHVLEWACQEPSQLVEGGCDARRFSVGMRIHEAGEHVGSFTPFTEATQ
jgi:hypothetical protein